jgi:cellulose synthase/poly-beta-1,6-N-acetylglucosamine synthase-like glycosyltransferase
MSEGLVMAALLLLGYTYLGYPAVVWLLSVVRPRPTLQGQTEVDVLIVVVARNEAQRIARKIESCLAQDMAPHRLQVLVVSDGSTDGTEAVVKAYPDARVRLLAFTERRGKAACLVDAVAASDQAVLVFTDARQRLHPQAVSYLIGHFADPCVGAVSGELVFLADGASDFGQGVDAYWRYEKFIRRHESVSGSVVGVTGALYAMRRACFQAIPSETILDDVLIPMNAALQGWRILFEAKALAYDRPAQLASQERVRKLRTLAGNFQLLALCPQLLSPWRNPLFFRFVSHKVLRLLAPVALAALLIANLTLLDQGLVYRLLLMGQLALYGLPLLGLAWPRLRRLWPVRLCTTFLLMNWFVVLGLLEFMSNRQAHLWQAPAKRS